MRYKKQTYTRLSINDLRIDCKTKLMKKNVLERILTFKQIYLFLLKGR